MRELAAEQDRGEYVQVSSTSLAFGEEAREVEGSGVPGHCLGKLV